VFTAVLTGLGVACALYQWRISVVGAAWQASVLALLLMPASKRACVENSALQLKKICVTGDR
jgi:hypothetical protein